MTMMDDGAREDCLACRANRGDLMPPGGVIYQDALWRLEHCLEPIPMVGWLILKPLRHVETFADLTPDEAASLGPLARRITRAMTEVLAPARVYVCLYAEAVSHVHFQLIPRYHETPREHWGPGVFDLLSVASDQGRSLADVEAAAWAASSIRQRLGESA
jgi:diadenosine tetraphosphate (Ap4A) HIT family hydrolase